MKSNDTKQVTSKNSSITRVRPFFQTLFEKDRTGKSWLPKLILAMPQQKELAKALSEMNGEIADNCLREKEFKDGILGKKIKIQECFEFSLPPSKEFLKWALNNPNALTWPKKTFKPKTQYKRECLFGLHGEKAQKETIKEGLELLESQGVTSSSQQWWKFEGFTKMDCLIETENYLLGIEGKRTDTMSSSTDWLKDRNQVVRNIEVLNEMAKERKKEYAFILLEEDCTKPLTKEQFEKSLPHDVSLADELYAHYLGCLSWKEACEVTGINFEDLPKDISDIQT